MFFVRTNSGKSTKRKQVTFTQMFFMRIKSTKTTKHKQATFFLLMFLLRIKAHKNVVFYTQKVQKRI